MIVTVGVEMIDMIESLRNLSVALPTFRTEAPGTGAYPVRGQFFVSGIFPFLGVNIHKTFLFIRHDEDVEIIHG